MNRTPRTVEGYLARHYSVTIIHPSLVPWLLTILSSLIHSGISDLIFLYQLLRLAPTMFYIF